VRITGVDVLARPDARIPVSGFDGEHLPFPDASWDTVVFCDVLHHTKEPLALLLEATRVARHAVVIKDHSVEGALAKPTLRLMDFCGNAPHGVPLPYNYLTPRQWDDTFRASGLLPVEVRRQLGLYPPFADRIFGRSLHFLGLFRIPDRSLV
jgi:SAM-dependent methyltransferase